MAKAQTLLEQSQSDLVGMLDPVAGVAQELGLYMGERAGVPLWAALDKRVARFDPDTGNVVMQGREVAAFVNPNDFRCELLQNGDVAIIQNTAYRVVEIHRLNRRLWQLNLRVADDIAVDEHQYGAHTTAYP